MLPENWVTVRMGSGIVVVRPDRGREDDADDRTAAVAVGSSDTRGSGGALRGHAGCDRADQLPDRAAGGRRTARAGNRLAGPARTHTSAQGAAPFPEPGPAGARAGQAPRAPTGGDASLASRVAAGDRSGSAQ